MMDDPAVTDERQFLHDLASPLSIAYGLIGVVLEGLREREENPQSKQGELPAACLQRLEKAYLSLEAMNRMIQKRRGDLVTPLSRYPQDQPDGPI